MSFKYVPCCVWGSLLLLLFQFLFFSFHFIRIRANVYVYVVCIIPLCSLFSRFISFRFARLPFDGGCVYICPASKFTHYQNTVIFEIGFDCFSGSLPYKAPIHSNTNTFSREMKKRKREREGKRDQAHAKFIGVCIRNSTFLFT